MKTEADLHKYLKREAKKAGILFSKLESRSLNGWPDVILIKDSQIVFVELKSPSGRGRLSKMQEYVIAELQEHGATVLVIDSQAEVDAVIAALA